MKAEELMVGNYVAVKPSGMVIKVAAVHHKKVGYHTVSSRLEWIKQDLLEPIPLTAEILEKNGFNIENNNELTYSVWYDGEMHISIWYGKHFIEDLYISYVHQLQHALKLCGIEKEIIL